MNISEWKEATSSSNELDVLQFCQAVAYVYVRLILINIKLHVPDKINQLLLTT